VYAIALLQISTGDPVKISNTILFLGPFSGTVSERDLRSVLERPTDPSTFESLSGRYLAEYANGKPLRNGSLKGPSLDRVIASTTSPEGLSSIGALYNFESFGLPEARDFLSRAVVTRGGDSADWLIYYFVKNSWPEKDTEELLRSQSDLENALGLVRVRYLRGEKWIAVIRGNIGHYNDHRKLQALGTLSGLLGRHLGISDLTAAADEKRSLGTYDAEACDGFAPRSLSDLRSAGEATMNICLRQEALARLSVHELQQVEEGGWYSSPLSSFQKARFRQVYQMKN
jgi:hypothetical protein